MNSAQILKSGESVTVEFKESFDREALETAVAFANTKGRGTFYKMRRVSIGQIGQ